MITPKIGRNSNRSVDCEHSVVAINSVTATKIADIREKRITFTACLEPGIFAVDVYIRYYPEETDDIKQGRDVLSRNTMGNNALFRPLHEMAKDNIYTGEISAICLAGSVNLLITES